MCSYQTIQTQDLKVYAIKYMYKKKTQTGLDKMAAIIYVNIISEITCSVVYVNKAIPIQVMHFLVTKNITS